MAMENQSGFSIAVALLMGLTLQGCVGPVNMLLGGGSVDLNPRLRGDLLSSEGLPDGRFFSDGTCLNGQLPTHDCHFVSTLRHSLLTHQDLQRLRRSTFFWMESDGFPILSYEVIARNLDVITEDQPPKTVVRQATVGSCWGFPTREAETRRSLSGLEFVLNPRAIAKQVDVALQECAPPMAGATASEALVPVTSACIDQSIAAQTSVEAHPLPEIPPLCVKDVPLSARMMADLSYSVTLQSRSTIDLQAIWPGVTVNRIPLKPHLKTVPVEGSRLFSRRMEFMLQDRSPDGSTTLQWRWSVPNDSEQWQENFSPHIAVVNARVRKGPQTEGDKTFLPMRSLEFGRHHCRHTSASGDTEFAVQTCDSSMIHVTPAYDVEDFGQVPIDDGDRLFWTAEVRLPPGSTLVQAQDPVFLELDLTAFNVADQTGSGLRAEPAAGDLGLTPTGGPSQPNVPAFVLHNEGALVQRIDRVTVSGRDAAEFGTAILSSVQSSRSGSSASVPAVGLPVTIRAGTSVLVELTPQFRTMGEKQAEITVCFEDLRHIPRTIRVPLTAVAVSPLIDVVPRQLVFYTEGTTAWSVPSVERSVVLTNIGTAPFTRQRLTLEGPAAQDFEVLKGEHGLAPSDLAQPLRIDGGDAEVYRLRFTPSVAGDRRAVLRLHTSEGEVSAQLIGQCQGACQSVRRSDPPTERPTRVQ